MRTSSRSSPSAAISGPVVADLWIPRLDAFAPDACKGSPEKTRAWAIEEVKYTARAAKNLGIKVVTGFMGSPVWKYWYSFPSHHRQDGGGGLRKDRRALVADPGRVRQVRGPLRAGGPPDRDRLRLLHRRAVARGLQAAAGPGIQLRPQPPLLAGDEAPPVHPGLRRPDLPRAHEGRGFDPGRAVGDPGLAPRLRRQPPGLELPLPGSRRRGLREHHPGAQRRRLSGSALGGVGGFGHGARVRRQGGGGVRAQGGLRSIERGLRRRLLEVTPIAAARTASPWKDAARPGVYRSMKEILRLEHVSKTFVGVTALQGMSFDLLEGEVHCLCGENGAGKSTLIRSCWGRTSRTRGGDLLRGERWLPDRRITIVGDSRSPPSN